MTPERAIWPRKGSGSLDEELLLHYSKVFPYWKKYLPPWSEGTLRLTLLWQSYAESLVSGDWDCGLWTHTAWFAPQLHTDKHPWGAFQPLGAFSESQGQASNCLKILSMPKGPPRTTVSCHEDRLTQETKLHPSHTSSHFPGFSVYNKQSLAMKVPMLPLVASRGMSYLLILF